MCKSKNATKKEAEKIREEIVNRIQKIDSEIILEGINEYIKELLKI